MQTVKLIWFPLSAKQAQFICPLSTIFAFFGRLEEKQDIISCGAGASTKYVFPEDNRIERTENVKNIEHYVNRIDEMIERKRKYLG